MIAKSVRFPVVLIMLSILTVLSACGREKTDSLKSALAVVDSAGVLSKEERAALDRMIRGHYERMKNQFAVHIIPSLEG